MHEKMDVEYNLKSTKYELEGSYGDPHFMSIFSAFVEISLAYMMESFFGQIRMRASNINKTTTTIPAYIR